MSVIITVLIRAGSREAFSLVNFSSNREGRRLGSAHYHNVRYQEQQNRHSDESRQGDDYPQKQGRRETSYTV